MNTFTTLMLVGKELGDCGCHQDESGPIPAHHAFGDRPQEQGHEMAPLGTDSGVRVCLCVRACACMCLFCQ